MRIDVLFRRPAARRRPTCRAAWCAVIDVLRASTTIAAALANGARAVIPLESSTRRSRAAKTLERSDVLLAGERKMLRDPGLRPRQLAAASSRARRSTGKTVVMTTTNGTAALARRRRARATCVVGVVRRTSRRCSRGCARRCAAARDRHDRLRRPRAAVRARGCGLRGPVRARRRATRLEPSVRSNDAAQVAALDRPAVRRAT